MSDSSPTRYFYGLCSTPSYWGKNTRHAFAFIIGMDESGQLQTFFPIDFYGIKQFFCPPVDTPLDAPSSSSKLLSLQVDAALLLPITGDVAKNIKKTADQMHRQLPDKNPFYWHDPVPTEASNAKEERFKNANRAPTNCFRFPYDLARSHGVDIDRVLIEEIEDPWNSNQFYEQMCRLDPKAKYSKHTSAEPHAVMYVVPPSTHEMDEFNEPLKLQDLLPLLRPALADLGDKPPLLKQFPKTQIAQPVHLVSPQIDTSQDDGPSRWL